jgi:hypothetical protein
VLPAISQHLSGHRQARAKKGLRLVCSYACCYREMSLYQTRHFDMHSIQYLSDQHITIHTTSATMDRKAADG